MGELEIPDDIVGRSRIDPDLPAGFVIKHTLVSEVRGQFANFKGPVVSAPDPLKSDVTAPVDVSPIATGNTVRDDQVRSADFLGAGNHPHFTFVATSIRPDKDDDGVMLGCGGFTVND